MKASILINNFNYGRFLRQCIDSACAQTYDDTEVVVVDDGSTDNSIDIINSYSDKIVPVLKRNGGQASCFNSGFEHSRGDIIFFLDSDDVFHFDKVATVMQIYQSLNVQWCFDMVDQSKPLEISGPVSAADIKLCDFRASIAKGTFPQLPIPTSGLSFERNLLAKILPMPTASGITLMDNYLKFASSGLGVGAICAVPLTYQRIHGSNRYTGARQIKNLRADIMMETGKQLVRHFPFLSAIAIKLVSTAIAERVAQNFAQVPLLIGHWRASPFTLTEKLRITVLSALKAIRIAFGRQAQARYVGGVVARARRMGSGMDSEADDRET